MDSIQEALLRSGLVTKEKVEQVEKEKKQVQHHKTARQQPRHLPSESLNRWRVAQIEKHNARIQKLNTVISKKSKSIFDKMYEHETRQKFIIHLLWNYLPLERTKVLENWEGREKRDCCVCNTKLVSRSDLLEKIPDLVKESIEGLAKVANGQSHNISDAVQKVFSERVLLAMCSDSSKVLFCASCYRNFFEWVQLKLLRGDGKINGILTSVRKKLKNETVENNPG